MLVNLLDQFNISVNIFLIVFILALCICSVAFIAIRRIRRAAVIPSRVELNSAEEATKSLTYAFVDPKSQRELEDTKVDIISFVLTIAAKVLTTLITKLGEGSTDRVSAQDVKQLVYINVRSGPQSQIHIDGRIRESLADSVLDEVYELAERDEVLHVQDGDLRLRPGLAPSDDMVAFQISHLQEIVETRRNELLLSGAESAEANPANNDDISSTSDSEVTNSEDLSYVWIEPEQGTTDSQWDTAMRDMHERIRTRRQGSDR